MTFLLQIRAGEMVSVIGASGAGKSTLLHVLGTLDAPDQGDILYQGRSLVALEPAGLADFAMSHWASFSSFTIFCRNLQPSKTS